MSLTLTERNVPPAGTAAQTHTLFAQQCEQAINMPFTPKPPPVDPTAGDIKKLLDKHQIVFLTGRAGTGKTYLARQVVELLESQGKNIIACAPTGTAAENFGCGSTIHHLFGLKPKLFCQEEIGKACLMIKASKREIILNADYLIIDEISMARVDLIHAIDRLCRKIKGDKQSPFGGLKVLFCGDLYQLPPIVQQAPEKAYFNSHYGGFFFFNAPFFRENPMKCVELTKIYRQTDPHFLEILNRIRQGGMVITNGDLMNLNERYKSQLESSITLASTNKQVDYHNTIHLNNLLTEEVVLSAKLLKGEFKNKPYTEVLRLKPGTQVMTTRNSKQYVNGSVGFFSEMGEKPAVTFNGMKTEIENVKWEEYEYTFDQKTKKISSVIRAEAEQYPLIVAAAITIHRAQGKTLEKMTLDLRGSGCWEHGHLYTALSRAKSLDSIGLIRPIRRTDAVCATEVRAFMESSHLH